MISQLPTPAPGDIEKFLITATAILSMTAVGKKFFKRNDSDLVTKAELNSLGDKLDARLAALAEKVDQLSKSVHERLTELHSNVARLDERTKK